MRMKRKVILRKKMTKREKTSAMLSSMRPRKL
jgi:hypothetical protein